MATHFQEAEQHCCSSPFSTEVMPAESSGCGPIMSLPLFAAAFQSCLQAGFTLMTCCKKPALTKTDSAPALPCMFAPRHDLPPHPQV